MLLAQCIVLFLVFSLMGWIWESLYCTICDKKWANRGFLYGPYCPIYGAGGIVGFCIYKMIENGMIPELPWYGLFLCGFFTSAILELFTSYVLEKLFYAKWWDYSNIPLNFHGRTSVPTSAGFGLATILIMKYLMPEVDVWVDLIPEWLLFGLGFLITILLTMDGTLTISELTNFQRYVAQLDQSFQTHMTDMVENIRRLPENINTKAVRRIVSWRIKGSKLKFSKAKSKEHFDALMDPYLDDSRIQKMDEFVQHGSTSTLEHVKNVAWVSYFINKKLHLNADEKELLECAILHDYYLYDWHEDDDSHKLHGFHHPKVACENAMRDFQVSETVQKAIKSHMWPLTITAIPKNREGIILCLADKYCAIIETIRRKKMAEGERD